MRRITDAEIENGGMREGESIEPIRCALIAHSPPHRPKGQSKSSPPQLPRAIPVGVALEDPPYRAYRRSSTDPFS